MILRVLYLCTYMWTRRILFFVHKFFVDFDTTSVASLWVHEAANHHDRGEPGQARRTRTGAENQDRRGVLGEILGILEKFGRMLVLLRGELLP